jgi:quinol monooxygenase YgiN
LQCNLSRQLAIPFAKCKYWQAVFVHCGTNAKAQLYLHSYSTMSHFEDARKTAVLVRVFGNEKSSDVLWLEGWENNAARQKHMASANTQAHISWLSGLGFSFTLGHGVCPEGYMRINSDACDANRVCQIVFITCKDETETKKYMEHTTTAQFFTDCSSTKGNSFTAVVPVKNHEDKACAVAWFQTWNNETSLTNHNTQAESSGHIEWLRQEQFQVLRKFGEFNHQQATVDFNSAKVCMAVMVHCKSKEGVDEYLNAESTLVHLQSAREAKGNAYCMIVSCSNDVLWIEGFKSEEDRKAHMESENTGEHIKFVRQNQWDFTLGHGIPNKLKIQDCSVLKSSRVQVVFVDCGDEKGANTYLNSVETQKHFNDAASKAQCSYVVLFQSGKHCVWVETWDGDEDFNNHMNSDNTKAHIDWLHQKHYSFELASGTVA